MQTAPDEDILVTQLVNPPGIGNSSSRKKPQWNGAQHRYFGGHRKSEWRQLDEAEHTRYRDNSLEAHPAGILTNAATMVGLVVVVAGFMSLAF